jgi:hypothetical protein
MCVCTSCDVTLWEETLSGQIYLGDEAFVQRMQAYAASPQMLLISLVHSAALSGSLAFGWFDSARDRLMPMLAASRNPGPIAIVKRRDCRRP